MASQVPAVKNVAFDLYGFIYKSDGTVIANPGGLTARVCKDGTGAAASNSVSVADSTGGTVKLTLTSTEMNGDCITVKISSSDTGAVPFTAILYTSAQLLDDVDTEVDAIKAKTDNLPASPAAVGSAMTLTSDYDAAKSAASQTSLNTVASYVDTEVAAIKAKTDQLVFADSKVNANASVSLTAQDIQDIADGVIAQMPGAGTGDTPVDHDTGGADNLRVTTAAGVGVDNATITAYLKSDYLAGNTGAASVRGNATTGPDGRWLAPMYLDGGYPYVLTIYRQGVYNVTIAEVTP